MSEFLAGGNVESYVLYNCYRHGLMAQHLSVARCEFK